MGLPRAFKAHHQGNLEEAERHYQRAFQQGERSPVLFQNLGALLRQRGDEEAALRLYAQGIQLHPHHAGIRTNRANLLYERAPATAIQDLLMPIRLRLAAGTSAAECRDLFKPLISLQRELGHGSWALATAITALRLMGPEPMLLGQLLVLLDSDAVELSESVLQAIQQELEKRLDLCEPRQRAELRLALAAHDMGKGELVRALRRFEQGLAALQADPTVDHEEVQARQ